MKLHLVRHAITASNRDIVYAGRNDEPVLKEATSGLVRAVEALAEHDPVKIFSSPLRRTLMTAEAIAGKLSLAVELVPELTELDFGPWTGLTGPEIRSKYPEEWEEWRKNPFSVQLDGMETLCEVQNRSVGWILSQEESDDDIVAVTHESVIKAVLCSIHPYRSRAYRELVIDNCSITSLSVDKQRGIEKFELRR